LGKVDSSSKAGETNKTDETERTEKSEKTNKTKRTEKANKTKKADKVDKTEKTNKMDKTERESDTQVTVTGLELLSAHTAECAQMSESEGEGKIYTAASDSLDDLPSASGAKSELADLTASRSADMPKKFPGRKKSTRKKRGSAIRKRAVTLSVPTRHDDLGVQDLDDVARFSQRFGIPATETVVRGMCV
jgi:hypothetical protein